VTNEIIPSYTLLLNSMWLIERKKYNKTDFNIYDIETQRFDNMSLANYKCRIFDKDISGPRMIFCMPRWQGITVCPFEFAFFKN